jgi:hypothetical protein
MKFDYLHQINQGAWFCRAGILGGLYLETAWPHMGRFVDERLATMGKILTNYVMRDGGADEGIGYYCMTAHAVIPALIAYARCRGKSVERLIGRHFGNADTYIATLSGLRPGKAAVDCDCRTGDYCGDIVPVMAGLFPDSICNHILSPCIETRHLYNVSGSLTSSGGIIGFVYGPDVVKEARPVVPTFNIMTHSGYAVSARTAGAAALRILLTGSKANPSGHAHLDKGAFVLELDAGELFVDRGMLPYDDPNALLVKTSRMHNVLTPCLPDGSYPDQSRPERAMIPRGSGDLTSCTLTIDLAPVWREHMSAYSRGIASRSLNEVVVSDRGALNEPGKVAFHLHSAAALEVQGTRVTGAVGDATFEVAAAWASEVVVSEDDLSFDGRKIRHLVLHSDELERFFLDTRITFDRAG